MLSKSVTFGAPNVRQPRETGGNSIKMHQGRKRVKLTDYVTPSGQFYGRRDEEKLSMVEIQTVKSLLERKNKRQRLVSTFRIYTKLKDAIDTLNKMELEHFCLRNVRCHKRLRVICFEWEEGLYHELKKVCDNFHQVFPNNSLETELLNVPQRRTLFRQTRYFLLVSFNTFWPFYYVLEKKLRHFYEIVMGGRPCFLYFDLERPRLKDLSEENQMLKCLLSQLGEQFKKKLKMKIDIEKDVVVLNSTSKKKVSYHLIVRPFLEGKFHCFLSTKDCNVFVKSWVEEMKANLETKEMQKLKYLLFYNLEDKIRGKHLKCVIDTAVYTKNRNFRFLLSTKKGKENYFEIDKDRFEDLDADEVFLKTLITNIEDSETMYIVCDPEDYDFVEKKAKVKKVKKYTVDEIPQQVQRKNDNRVLLHREAAPKLEAFIIGKIKSKMKDHNLSGKDPWIREKYYFPKFKMLHFYIADNRFCEKIEREHKSNHVYYVLFLENGLYKQGCCDPDCAKHPFIMCQIPNKYIDDCSTF